MAKAQNDKENPYFHDHWALASAQTNQIISYRIFSEILTIEQLIILTHHQTKTHHQKVTSRHFKCKVTTFIKQIYNNLLPKTQNYMNFL